MPRLTPSLTCAALLCAATPAFAASEGARIEGTWMAIGDMLGVLPGHIEVLTIEGDRATSVTWRKPSVDCGAERQAPGCVLPIPTASGAFHGNSFEIGIEPDAANASPFAGEEVAPLWPLLALDGAPWTMFRQDGRLMTTREATIAETTIPMIRLWLQVDPALPGALYDYLVTFDLDIARALCPVSTLHADPQAWEALSATLIAAAPVLEGQRIAVSGLAPPPAAAESEAAEAFALLAELAAEDAEPPEGVTLLPGLPWPASQAMADAAQDCLDRAFGG